MEDLPETIIQEIRKLISRNEFYSAEEMFPLVHDLVSALSFLERIGIAHPDLTLTNAMKPDDGTYKLVDFGVMIQQEFN